MGPILLGACALTVARGTLAGGLSPTGYKLMRRVPHNAKGLRLGSNGQATWIDQYGLFSEVTPTPNLARHALSPSTPHAFGVTLRALGVDRSRGQAEELPWPFNAELRSVIERKELENEETTKKLLTGVASYK